MRMKCCSDRVLVWFGQNMRTGMGRSSWGLSQDGIAARSRNTRVYQPARLRGAGRQLSVVADAGVTMTCMLMRLAVVFPISVIIRISFYIHYHHSFSS